MTKSTCLLLGFDGGATSTDAYLAEVQPDGQSFRVLGRGTGGPTNLNNVSVSEGQRALHQARSAAFLQAQLPEQPVDAACLGLAGIWSGNNEDIVRDWAESTQLTHSGRFEITSDIRIVLTAGTPKDWGVALICGTGSCAIGRTLTGEPITVGGHGSDIGDEGSAFALGHRACQIVSKIIDKRFQQPTCLVDDLMGYFRVPTARGIMSALYKSGDTRTTRYANLAPLVMTAAMKGDSVAMEIVVEQATELAVMVETTMRRLNLAFIGTPLALTGSTLLENEFYINHLTGVLKRKGIFPGPIELVHEPVIGALRRALALL